MKYFVRFFSLAALFSYFVVVVINNFLLLFLLFFFYSAVTDSDIALRTEHTTLRATIKMSRLVGHGGIINTGSSLTEWYKNRIIPFQRHILHTEER